MKRQPRGWILLLGVWLVLAVACQLGWLAADWRSQHDGAEFLAPSAANPLGTDHLGRDLLAQTLQGSRIAFLVGSLAAGAAVLIGAALGLAAAWYRGPVDALCNWLSGAVAAIPGMLLVVVVAALLGHGLLPLCTAFAVVSWVGVYRLVRAEARRLVDQDYVLAARACGAPPLRLMLRHLMPALRPMLLAQFSLAFVAAIKAEAVLSFLGVGLAEQPSWGRMIADAWALGDLEQGRWWRLAAASGALALLALPVYRLADRAHEQTPTA